MYIIEGIYIKKIIGFPYKHGGETVRDLFLYIKNILQDTKLKVLIYREMDRLSLDVRPSKGLL